MVEPLASLIPLLTTGGNHEVQSGENWVPYQLRYPTPFAGALSPDPAYYGREVGPVHVIALNSYADFSNTSLQYRWLETYMLTRVNRARTPWVVVMVHVSLYHSNVIHWKEGELFRRAMEPLLYQWGVDIVLSGHLHAYERTAPMYNFQPDECGMVHLILGDGGNYEGEATPWRVDEGTESGALETSDTAWIIRPLEQQCPNRFSSSDFEPVVSSDEKDNGEDSDDDAMFSKRALEILVIALVTCCLGLLGLVTEAFLYRNQGYKLASDEGDIA
ncbi:PAP18 [Symbiodinium microadriaticum]|nr:PAP18 [Symbiodinium microadriaticum]